MNQSTRPLLSLVALAPLALAVSQAWAQTAPTPDPAAALGTGTAGAAEPTAGSAAGQGQLQEVVVTAQRRSQSALKTPLALSVVTGDELKDAGAYRADALTQLVPGVQFGLNNGAMNISIRGVTSNDASEKGDPSASFNLDGINLARPQAAGTALFDINRVEVLRGPQGTLYGRNSTAGAVNVITNKPSNRFEAGASLDIGNYESRQLDAMINVPVNDTLALRAALFSADHLGYIEAIDPATNQPYPRGRDDQKSLSARIHAQFKFGADYSLLLTADSSTMKGAGIGSIDTAAYLADRSLRSTAVATEGRRDDGTHGIAMEFKARTALGEVTYLGGQRVLDLDNVSSPGSLPIVATSLGNFKQQTHELRLASSDNGPVQWVGGLFYFDERSSSLLDVNLFGTPSALVFDQDPVKSRSTAAFGQATWSVAQDTRLTGGLRYTRDDKSRSGSNSAFGFSTPNDAAVSYSQTNWKIGVDHDLRPNLMAFASLSTGYKAGGFNDGTEATNPNLYYAPEHLTAFEAGLKGRLLDGQMTLSLSGFYYDYNDLQLTSLPAGATTQVTTNAAQARVYGVEAEGRVALTPLDKLSFAVSGLSAKYKSYMPSPTVDWSGKSLDKSPAGTIALGYGHVWPLASGGSIDAHVQMRWSASYVVSDFANSTQYDQPSFTRTDLRLAWTSADDRWTAQAYVRNLESKTQISGFAFGTFTITDPRTIGASVALRF